MKKKIGTLSLNVNTDDLNYGAVLHSYAFQKFLCKFDGVECEIIDYVTPSLENINLKYPFFAYFKEKKFRTAILSLLRCISHAKRFNKFKNFISSNMVLSKKKYTKTSLESELLVYDCLVCESDVIWSPGFFGGGFDITFFLGLKSMQNIKKVAYSASMANCQLNTYQEELFKNLIKGIDVISLRESYAAKYTQQFTEKPVVNVLDPVFLLTENDYIPIVSKRMINKPYILVYFPLEFNNSIIKRAKEYAKSRNLKIIELSRYPWEKFRHKTIMDAGIEEFLSLIYYADCVFSNSFHAVCFSIIFKKEFYAFDRKTGRKIYDICERLGLQNRFVSSTFQETAPINYEEVYSKLSLCRQNSIDYIVNNIIDE